MRSACGRADLVRALATHGEAGLLATARILGFEHRPEARSADPPADSADPLHALELGGVQSAPPRRQRPPLNPLPFWICTTFADVSEGPAAARPRPLEPADLVPAPAAPPPPVPELMSWPRLWRWLRTVLTNRESAGEIDTDRLVLLLSRAQRLPGRLPRRRVRRLAPQVLLVRDRSPRLGLFDRDQVELERRLERVLGRSRMTVVSDGSMPPSDQGQAWRQLPRGTPALALTDLGAYAAADDATARHWDDFGKDLAERGLAPNALVPVPRSRWRLAAGPWRTRVWDRLQGSDPEPPAEEVIEQRALRLLRLVSPAMRCEPGLLRAARRLLPPAAADVGTEVDVWNHPSVELYNAAYIDRATLSQLRANWTAESREIRAAFVALLRAFHAGASPYVVHEETATITALDPSLVTPAEVAAAKSFLPRLAAGGRYDAWLPDWVDRQLHAAPLEARRGPGELTRIYRDLRRARRKQRALRPAAPEANRDPSRDARLVAITQCPGGIEPRPFAPATPVAAAGPGSLVALAHWAETTLHVQLDGGEPYSIAVEPGGGDPIPPTGPLEIETDLDSLTIERIVRPDWAAAMGRDRYGLWAEVELGETLVKMRLRYIPPGRFQMGSPPGEAGHDTAFYRETQHEVILTRGYWLGETPVTQAQWHAVMGTNPSRFRAPEPEGSPNRPVEQVSWNDAKDFLAAAGFGLRLPTEAEWERACRAGTITATYAGDLEIRGENDAPVLDLIAWHGGNSGKEYDLEDGEDSSGWPNQQHSHQKAGTRNVGEKLANGFGLRDMLGNVWEWCADWMADYPPGAVTAPVGPDEGSGRVLRGRSWFSHAGLVRAAFRGAGAPADRGDDAGFRCARGQEERAVGAAEPREEAAEPREEAAEPPNERRSRSGAGRATRSAKRSSRS